MDPDKFIENLSMTDLEHRFSQIVLLLKNRNNLYIVDDPIDQQTMVEINNTHNLDFYDLANKYNIMHDCNTQIIDDIDKYPMISIFYTKSDRIFNIKLNYYDEDFNNNIIKSLEISEENFFIFFNVVQHILLNENNKKLQPMEYGMNIKGD